MEDKNTKFQAIARFNEDGNLDCLCAYELFEEGRCACAAQGGKDVCEVLVDITILPTRTLKKTLADEMGKLNKEVKGLQKEISKAAIEDVKKVRSEIKRGVAELEKAIKGSRFRF